MEVENMTLKEILKMMEKNLGEEPRPMVLMSKLLPDMVVKQAQNRKFVMELSNIQLKYK